MQISTRKADAYIIQFLKNFLPRNIFCGISTPGTDCAAQLMDCMKFILLKNMEVNAENIYLESKNHLILGKYMDIVNKIDSGAI